MAFFDEIGKTLADKSKEAAQKAKGVAEVLQLKAQISSENSKVKELYGAIGALYFKNNREEPADDYQMFFPEIEKSLAHIAEMEAKVKELEGIHCCDVCGAPLRKNDVFCSKCGAQVKVEEEVVEAEVETAEAENEAEDVIQAIAETADDMEDAPESVFVDDDEE